MNSTNYPRVASLKTAEAFRRHLEQSGIPLAFDDDLVAPAASPLAQPIEVDGVRVGNRFCILPMEGWDGTRDGEPSDLTRRRWRNFGTSGAKLMWGGEAVAVRHDGRANPQQLMMSPRTVRAIASLREELVAAHRERFGSNADGDLYVGLQLTHSGRYARPDVYDRPAPIAACSNPLLDRRFPNGVRVFADAELDALVDDFVAAARLARDAGFQFVDVKACHGYLGHELLGARTRSGPYGGSIDGRTRFMRRVIEAIRADVAGLAIVVRLSAFDTVPYRKRPTDLIGEPELTQSDRKWRRLQPCDRFRRRPSDDELDAALDDARAVLRMLERLGVNGSASAAAVRTTTRTCSGRRRSRRSTATSRRRIRCAACGGRFRRRRSSSATSRRWCSSAPRTATCRSGCRTWASTTCAKGCAISSASDASRCRIPICRPTCLSGAPLKRAAFCRTFSDCTTGPRLGLVSGLLSARSVLHCEAGSRSHSRRAHARA
jgi:2,4-dienoyl-CoA reductase-like NADH-dependent reductase (Old Yellow Enzyme family)